MRRMVRHWRASVLPGAAPLAVVSVMCFPPSGLSTGASAPPGSPGPRALFLLVRGLHRDGGCRLAYGLLLMAGMPRVIVLRPQRGYLFLEVGQRLKPPVHGGESQVGDLVKLAKRAQDREADVVRRNLSATAALDNVFHPLGQDSELILADGSALAGAPYASDDLVPVEGLGDAAALGDHEDDRLLGRAAGAARRARPPAAGRRALIGRAA